MESELLRFKKEQLYLFWDGESEDLRLWGNRPWQISYVLATQNQILEEYDEFPWWSDLEMSEDAARITRFNYDDYKRKAKAPNEILKKFNEKLYNPNIINVFANGYNFDVFLHNTFMNFCGQRTNYSYVSNSICIQCIEKAIILGQKEFSQDPLKRAAQMFSLTNFKRKGLKTNVRVLCEKYGVNYDSDMAHDGIVDCRYTREIFNKQIWQINI